MRKYIQWYLIYCVPFHNSSMIWGPILLPSSFFCMNVICALIIACQLLILLQYYLVVSAISKRDWRQLRINCNNNHLWIISLVQHSFLSYVRVGSPFQLVELNTTVHLVPFMYPFICWFRFILKLHCFNLNQVLFCIVNNTLNLFMLWVTSYMQYAISLH